MKTLTKAAWKATLKDLQKDLAVKYPSPEFSPALRFEISHKVMRQHYGPEPPGLIGAAIKAAFKVKVKGESMKWELKKGAWKGIRAALGGALAIGVGAVSDALIASADSAPELAQLGAPAVLIPVLLGLGAMYRNWRKMKKQAKEEQFVTPPDQMQKP